MLGKPFVPFRLDAQRRAGSIAWQLHWLAKPIARVQIPPRALFLARDRFPSRLARVFVPVDGHSGMAISTLRARHTTTPSKVFGSSALPQGCISAGNLGPTPCVSRNG